MTQRFQTLTLATCANEQASKPASVTMTDNVISLLLEQQTRDRLRLPRWTETSVSAECSQAVRGGRGGCAGPLKSTVQSERRPTHEPIHSRHPLTQ